MSILPTISYKRRNTTAKSINTPISDKSGKETPMNSPKLTFASPISQNHQPALTIERWLHNWQINKDNNILSSQPLCSDIVNHLRLSWYTSIATKRKTSVWNEANKWIYIIYLTENQEINKETSYSFWIRWNRLNTGTGQCVE